MAGKEMDIDVPSTSQNPSAVKHGSSSTVRSSPKPKRAKLDMPEDPLTTVYSAMDEESELLDWPNTLNRSIVNPKVMYRLNSTVLTKLTGLLSTTVLKDTVHPPLDNVKADKVLADFSHEETTEWETAIEKGITRRDWADLIAHRAFLFTFVLGGLTV
jgi:hypothetical protein